MKTLADAVDWRTLWFFRARALRIREMWLPQATARMKLRGKITKGMAMVRALTGLSTRAHKKETKKVKTKVVKKEEAETTTSSSSPSTKKEKVKPTGIGTRPRAAARASDKVVAASPPGWHYHRAEDEAITSTPGSVSPVLRESSGLPATATAATVRFKAAAALPPEPAAASGGNTPLVGCSDRGCSADVDDEDSFIEEKAKTLKHGKHGKQHGKHGKHGKHWNHLKHALKSKHATKDDQDKMDVINCVKLSEGLVIFGSPDHKRFKDGIAAKSIEASAMIGSIPPSGDAEKVRTALVKAICREEVWKVLAGELRNKIDCMDRFMVQSELLMRRYRYVPPHEEEDPPESRRMAWH